MRDSKPGNRFFARDLVDLPRLRWVLVAVAIGVLSGPLLPWGCQ